MSNDVRVVYIYVFDLQEQYSSNDYVKMAVKHCLNCENAKIFRGMTYTDASFEIKRTAYGKPYFQNCQNIGFSVSHSGEYCVCALTDNEIGVDIERRGTLSGESVRDASNRLCKIADRFFHPEEASCVKSEPLTRFYEIFTAKESYVKYKGTGFDDTLGENSVLPKQNLLPSCHQSVDAVIWKSVDAQFWQTVYHNDYVLCFCTDSSDMPPTVNIIDFVYPR